MNQHDDDGLRTSLDLKSTDELWRIYEQRDISGWSENKLEIVRQILTERGMNTDLSPDPAILKLAISTVGFIAGGWLGFLTRPSVMGVQLPFEAIVTRGESLTGVSDLAIPLAQSSFNYLLAGAVIGAFVGFLIAVTLVLPKLHSTHVA